MMFGLGLVRAYMYLVDVFLMYMYIVIYWNISYPAPCVQQIEYVYGRIGRLHLNFPQSTWSRTSRFSQGLVKLHIPLVLLASACFQ